MTLKQFKPSVGSVVFKHYWHERSNKWLRGMTPWIIMQIVDRGCVVSIKPGCGSPHKHLLEWQHKVSKTPARYK